MKKLSDLLYRFLLWFSVSFFLHFMASLSDGKQGRLIVEALRSPPNVVYGEALAGFAGVLFVIALMMFDIHRGVKRVGFAAQVVRSVTHWLSRVAADLLLSVYGMASFLLGWISYDWLFRSQAPVPKELTQGVLLGFGVAEFLILLGALGLMSMVVRIAPRARWVRGWYKVRVWLRVYAYASALLAIAIVFWF